MYFFLCAITDTITPIYLPSGAILAGALTETVANSRDIMWAVKRIRGKGMHGIICDGGASKFFLFTVVESLNLEHRGLLHEAKCRAFRGRTIQE
jgi:hypothetical protein